MQLKYSNYAAFSHVHGRAVNNSGLDKEILQRYDEIICMRNGKISGIGDYETLYSQNMYFRGLCENFRSEK